MLKDNRSQQFSTGESEWLEYAFYRCTECWKKINACFFDQGFDTEDQEIYFFKYIKPRFTGLLSYYTRCYQCLLFRPNGSKEQVLYYQRELIKAEKFFVDHAEFYAYYIEDRSDQDKEYFIRIHRNPTCPFEKLYSGNTQLVSLKDRLAAEVIAHNLYRDHLLKILSAYDDRPQGAVIDICEYIAEDFRNVSGFP